MSLTKIRRVLALAAVALVPVLPITTSCSRDTLPAKGQLMLVVTTNLAPPKDFDSMQIRVVEEGSSVPIHELVYALDGSQAVKLPATLGVVAGSDPNRTVRVTVQALRRGQVRVTRDAIARVPRDRVASLPLPIDGLCVDKTACGSDPDGKPLTCVAGRCVSASVETEGLSDYLLGEVFGGGTGNGDGVCFDTLACFTNGRAVAVDPSDCSIERDTASGFGFNVAVVRPPGSDGICASNACLLPLDLDRFTGPIRTGWREVPQRATLPPIICDAGLPVMVTTSCTTKAAPTCGPWSATGSARALGDASLPFDGGFPVGDGAAPSPFPQAVRFRDEDPRLGFVKGTVTIVRATDETSVTDYELHWGDGPSKTLGLVTSLKKTGADVTHLLDGPVAPGATHLLAFSRSKGDLRGPVSAGPIDNYPRATGVTAGGNDLRLAVVLGDAQNDRVLVAGFDERAGATRPALLRCQRDGSGCTYADISAGRTGTFTGHGAALDVAGKKLLFVSDLGAGAPFLHRCELDGTGCTATSTGASFTAGACRIPVLVDTANRRVLTVTWTTTTLLTRCGLDGLGCTTQAMGPNTNICPDAAIDAASSKLLVFQRSNADQRPAVQRCELDGTNCVVNDVSGGFAETVSELSGAIDTKNQKLLVVTSRTNAETFYLYRCNRDATGCVGGPLGPPYPAGQGPSQPKVVVDTEHDKLFVFGYAQTGFYLRCNLDGSGCTVTTTFPVGSGSGYQPDAILFGGRLFAASQAFNPSGLTPGVDLVSLAAY